MKNFKNIMKKLSALLLLLTILFTHTDSLNLDNSNHGVQLLGSPNLDEERQ